MSRITLALCIAICVVLSGCSTQEEPETAAVEIENVPKNTPALPPAKEQVEIEQSVEESSTVDVPTDESETETEAEEDLALATDSFEPPFPDRVELFLAPKRAGRGIKKSIDGVDNSVELLGFVNVSGQRVVLSIDGLVSPIAEGGMEAGIEVISIQPPSVVLQRGRQRWQVTLEN